MTMGSTCLKGIYVSFTSILIPSSHCFDNQSPCSVAIMKYLVSKYNLPDHWYPSDIKQRAKIDEYLHWHGGNLRMGAAWYLFNKVGWLTSLLSKKIT